MSQQRSRRERRPNDEPVCAGLYRALRASPDEQQTANRKHRTASIGAPPTTEIDQPKRDQRRKRRDRTLSKRTKDT